MTNIRRMMAAVAFLPAAVSATGFQDLEAINASAVRAAGGNVVPVDQRLKLAACPDALIADPPAFGAVIVRCASFGWRIRVLIEPDTAIAQRSAIIIRRGDPVSVNFVAPGFSVATMGIAESDARIGERVRVRVAQKESPVMGEAMNAGSVRVGSLN